MCKRQLLGVSVNLFWLMVLAVGPVAGQTAGEQVMGVVAAGDLTEDWRPPKFNAADLPGLRIVGPAAKSLIVAAVPADLAGGLICVRIIAAKDHYFGMQTFSVLPGWLGGQTAIPLQTAYVSPPQDLTSVPPEDALIRVSVGSCEMGTSDTLLLAGWRTRTESGQVYIYANALLEERVELVHLSSGQMTDCMLVADESQSYTHRCSLDMTGLATGRQQLELRRFKTVIKNGQASEEAQSAHGFELWVATP